MGEVAGQREGPSTVLETPECIVGFSQMLAESRHKTLMVCTMFIPTLFGTKAQVGKREA